MDMDGKRRTSKLSLKDAKEAELIKKIHLYLQIKSKPLTSNKQLTSHYSIINQVTYLKLKVSINKYCKPTLTDQSRYIYLA